MSNNVMTLLEAALKNSDLQKQLHKASTPDRFVNIAEENGYILSPNELAQTLGKFHAIFGPVVESMLDSMPPDLDSNNTTETIKAEKVTGANLDLVKRLFSRGEAFDSEGFVTFFTDNPIYQFGNFDVCLDKQSIKQSADNFFSQINAAYHEIKKIWEVGNLVFVEMDVTYWRKDASMISLPCCDIFRVEGDKFSELRIFMDVSPVFDSSIPVPASASVLTANAATRLIPPGTMKQHFAQHPEGQQRVRDGFAPKWSTSGPQWAIAEQDPPGSPEQLDAVGNLAQAVIAQDWDTVKSYLTDDIYYKVGSGEPLYGKQAVVDFFIQTFKTTAVFTGHMVRKIWQEPDIITLEMDAYYQMVTSGKTVTIACCDIYRLRGNKVSEWRVYADMSPWNESTI
jgi:limonene-1,2-epoxide hydrolase